MVQKFPIDNFVEDLFEVTSCYFPITFAPPPDDPIGITREDLVFGLQACLGATAQFAPLCLDLILDKVLSSFEDAKQQCFALLSAVAPAYGVAGLEPCAQQIYIAVRTHLFQMTKEPVKQDALKALTAVLRVLTRPNVTPGATAILEPLCVDSVAHITDFDVTMIDLHTRLLTAAVAASGGACTVILCSYLQPVVQRVAGLDAIHRHAVLRSILHILWALPAAFEAEHTAAVTSVRDALLGMLVTFAFAPMEAEETRVLALETLQALAATRTMLPPQHVMVCRHTVELLEDTETSVRLRTAAIRLLDTVGGVMPAVVINQVVTVLGMRLLTPQEQSSVQLVYVLGAITTASEVACAVVPHFLALLDTDHCQADPQLLAGVSRALLAVAQNATDGLSDMLVWPLIDRLGTHAPAVNPAQYQEALDFCVTAIVTHIQRLQPELQRVHVTRSMELLLSEAFTIQRAHTIPLVLAVLSSVQTSALPALAGSDLPLLLDYLWGVAMTRPEPECQPFVRCFAALLNKIGSTGDDYAETATRALCKYFASFFHMVKSSLKSPT